MFPGMNFTPPDPEKLMQAMENLKTAFNEAAAADTGSAQPHFQKLSDIFDQLVTDSHSLSLHTNPDPAAVMRQMAPVLMQLQGTMSKLQGEASRNPAAAETLQTLLGTLQSELAEVIPGLPGLPSGRKPGAAPKPPAPPRPKKPGNGKFNL